jgi:hypothetical protein
MTSLKTVVEYLKNTCEKYPAVVTGYFLAGYSFIAIIRMVVRAKRGSIVVEDLYDVFSALPFMWLLAMSIVQIIHERSRLRLIQDELAREQLKRQITEIQLSALKDAEKALHHNINNPLAVIALSLARLKRAVRVDRDLTDKANDIEYASQKIGSVLSDFSRTQLR